MGLRRQSRYLPGVGCGRGLAWEEGLVCGVGGTGAGVDSGVAGAGGWHELRTSPTAILSGFESRDRVGSRVLVGGGWKRFHVARGGEHMGGFRWDDTMAPGGELGLWVGFLVGIRGVGCGGADQRAGFTARFGFGFRVLDVDKRGQIPWIWDCGGFGVAGVGRWREQDLRLRQQPETTRTLTKAERLTCRSSYLTNARRPQGRVAVLFVYTT